MKSVIIKKDEQERLFKIEESSATASAGKPAVLMRFEGIDNPEKAKSLNGAQLITGREEASPLKSGEFYIEDLKGLPVFSQFTSVNSAENSDNIGIITDIIEGGGGELAEIKLSNGEIRLIPFRKEFFPEIDPSKSKVILQNLWILE